MTNDGTKTGRKPLPTWAKREQVNTNILPSLKAWLEQHAKDNGRSFSAEVSLILLEYATEHGFIPPEENHQNREILESLIEKLEEKQIDTSTLAAKLRRMLGHVSSYSL